MQITAISNPSQGIEKAIDERVQSVPKETAIQLSPQDTKAEHAQQIAKLQAELASNNISLSYRHDDDSNRLVITLVDSTTGEKIRQIPDEVVLKLSSELRGKFLNESV